MIKAKLKICIFIFLLFHIGQSLRAERKPLAEDIEDGYLNEYSKIEAAFILSGITHPDSLDKYVDWYDQQFRKIKDLPLEYDDPVNSARTVFLYLHTRLLKTYALESTTLADIVRNREYNCVAATILFNIVSEDLGWSCEAFETPTHVYTIFTNFRQKLIVENTSSMGFDIMKNLKAYSHYLAKYYPESDVLRIGLDKLYLHENSKGRTISNTELLGLLAYNRAYLAKKNKDFKSAYDYVLLAQQFNQDSRSNINFEIGLYYAWGKQLYAHDSFPAAFTVFADAYYRYPDIEDFRNNTIVCFNKTMQTNWRVKNWPESARLIEDMDDLNLLEKRNRYLLTSLNKWLHYFHQKHDEASALEIRQILEKID